MSSFTKKGLPLTEGDKVKWDGIQAIVVAVAEEDTECPYRVFSANHETSGWVAGEVLELVEAVRYEAVPTFSFKVGDLFCTPDGMGVLLDIDADDFDELPYQVGVFRVGSGWYAAEDASFVGRPDYGMEVGDAA